MHCCASLRAQAKPTTPAPMIPAPVFSLSMCRCFPVLNALSNRNADFVLYHPAQDKAGVDAGDALDAVDAVEQ